MQPKGLLHICRDLGVQLNNKLYDFYKKYPDETQTLFAEEYTALGVEQIEQMVVDPAFMELVSRYEYPVVPLARYIDSLLAHEALSFFRALTDLRDYAAMSEKMAPTQQGRSPRYERYPKNLLTVHHIVVRNYNRFQQTIKEEAFTARVDPSMDWDFEPYIVLYPRTTEEIKVEGAQHNPRSRGDT